MSRDQRLIFLSYAAQRAKNGIIYGNFKRIAIRMKATDTACCRWCREMNLWHQAQGVGMRYSAAYFTGAERFFFALAGTGRTEL